MNSENPIFKIIDSGPNALDANELESLIEKFPYFSTARALLLLSLARSNKVLPIEKVKEFSSHLHDRRHIYTLLTSALPEKIFEINTRKPDKVEENITTEPSIQVSDDIGLINLSNKPETEEIFDFSQGQDDTPSDEQETVDPSNETSAFPNDRSDFDLENEDESKFSIQTETPSIQNEDLNLENDGNTTPSPSTESSSIDDFPQTSRNFRWLDDLEDDHPGESGPNSPSRELIEQFMNKGQGVIRADKETSLKGDVSGDSVKEDEDFITDTLAKIYIKQGLYTKAIYAYEKLSLKYPEKSIYFATQIDDIKKIINKE